MGYFFVHAAFYDTNGASIGIDAALLALLQSSYGRFLVLLTAVGLVGHGILAFYEAKSPYLLKNYELLDGKTRT